MRIFEKFYEPKKNKGSVAMQDTPKKELAGRNMSKKITAVGAGISMVANGIAQPATAQEILKSDVENPVPQKEHVEKKPQQHADSYVKKHDLSYTTESPDGTTKTVPVNADKSPTWSHPDENKSTSPSTSEPWVNPDADKLYKPTEDGKSLDGTNSADYYPDGRPIPEKDRYKTTPDAVSPEQMKKDMEKLLKNPANPEELGSEVNKIITTLAGLLEKAPGILKGKNLVTLLTLTTSALAYNTEANAQSYKDVSSELNLKNSYSQKIAPSLVNPSKINNSDYFNLKSTKKRPGGTSILTKKSGKLPDGEEFQFKKSINTPTGRPMTIKRSSANGEVTIPAGNYDSIDISPDN